jgi:hypothetical protein
MAIRKLQRPWVASKVVELLPDSAKPTEAEAAAKRFNSNKEIRNIVEEAYGEKT